MSGALYLMNQNGMIDTGLMAVVFIVFVFAMLGGAVSLLVEWVKERIKR